MNKGNTIIFTTPFDSNERTGVIQEVTSAGYLVNGVWYGKNDIKVKNILLDSRNSYDNNQLILG
jgi:hypothetical protein